MSGKTDIHEYGYQVEPVSTLVLTQIDCRNRFRGNGGASLYNIGTNRGGCSPLNLLKVDTGMERVLVLT